MSDEVYEGAIGIDLGAHFRKIILPHSAIANEPGRHDLLLRCQLRGHQCRDQYAPAWNMLAMTFS
jgi:hypothetical protein